ncbi:MAG: hypothetical protein Q7Q71_14825 [Verrucomicrobiota bacterium JB023]|nr:hypothetical protein [Verrucomicrobiota bacterium JB023]
MFSSRKVVSVFLGAVVACAVIWIVSSAKIRSSVELNSKSFDATIPRKDSTRYGELKKPVALAAGGSSFQEPTSSSETLNSVLQKAGAGKRRGNLIIQYFYNSEESIKSLLDEAETLLDGNDLNFALTGLKCRVALANEEVFNGLFNLPEDVILSAKHQEVLICGLAFRFNPMFSSATVGVPSSAAFGAEISESRFDAIFSKFLSLSERLDDSFLDEATEAFYQGASQTAASFAYQTLIERGDLSESISGETKGRIVEEMLLDDPESGFELIFSNRERSLESGGAQFQSIAIEKLFEVDGEKALEFEDRISDAEDGRFVATYQKEKASFFLESGNLAEAKDVAASVTDPNLSEQITSLILEHESKLVAEAAAIDPKNVVSSIVTGSSEFPQYHLSTALGEWINHDGDAAAQWAEEQVDQLPPETRQYIAAVYAKEAASQGDISLAQQWADLILDTDTAAEIQEVISKAEASAQH